MNEENVAETRKAVGGVLASLLEHHRSNKINDFDLDDDLEAACPGWYKTKDGSILMAYTIADEFYDQASHGYDFHAPMGVLDSFLQRIIESFKSGREIDSPEVLQYFERRATEERERQNSLFMRTVRFVKRLLGIGKEK